MMSTDVELCLHKAFVDARAARHEFVTVEHLLLALLDEPAANAALRWRATDIEAVRKSLVQFIKDNTPTVGGDDEVDSQPTLGFQRVLKRGITHAQSTGGDKGPLTGVHMLSAVFGERDSHAAYYLREQGFTREDLIAYVKSGGQPSDAPPPAPYSADRRAKELGLDLTVHSTPAGNYAAAVQCVNLLFVSSKAPRAVDGRAPRGRLGREYSAADGHALARSACTELLATLQGTLGSLDRVNRIVELHGALNTTEDFEDHAKVLDGASDLLVEVFGPAVGLHARSVIGAVSLRNGVPLTLKLTVDVR